MPLGLPMFLAVAAHSKKCSGRIFAKVNGQVTMHPYFSALMIMHIMSDAMFHIILVT